MLPTTARPTVHADARLDRRQAARTQLGGDSVADRQRRHCGIRCGAAVVGRRRRRAEDRHDRVADELVDDAALRQHRCAHAREVVVEERHQLLRLGPFRQRREALQVGEEQRDVARLAAEAQCRRIPQHLGEHFGRQVAAERAVHLALLPALDQQSPQERSAARRSTRHRRRGDRHRQQRGPRPQRTRRTEHRQQQQRQRRPPHARQHEHDRRRQRRRRTGQRAVPTRASAAGRHAAGCRVRSRAVRRPAGARRAGSDARPRSLRHGCRRARSRRGTAPADTAVLPPPRRG